MSDLLSMYEEVATGDWQREYLYKITFTPPTLILPLYPQNIDVFCLNFKAPGSKQKVNKKDWAGQWANFAGPLDNSGTTDGEFAIDENNVLMAFLEAWHALSGSDLTAAAFPKADFIGTMIATLYRTDKETPVLSTILSNVWIPEIGELSTDKTKDGFLTAKVTIAYDGRKVMFH